MTKQQILDRLNIRPVQLAAIFNISTSAVAQWSDRKPIPRLRWIELKYKLRPDAFTDIADDFYKSSKKKSAKKAA